MRPLIWIRNGRPLTCRAEAHALVIFYAEEAQIRKAHFSLVIWSHFQIVMRCSWRCLAGCIGLLLPATVWAQFPPTPEGITILKSKFNQDITISYKEVCVCVNMPIFHALLVLD